MLEFSSILYIFLSPSFY